MRDTAGKMRQGRGRAAFGLFAAVWLNLALQPCAMAWDARDEQHCPNCPPAEMQDHHGMHAGMAAAKSAGMPCADGLADCMLDQHANHDGRGAQPQPKDTPVASAAPPLAVAVLALPRGDDAPAPRYASVHPGAPPPLHLLNCVFLD